MVLQLVTPKAAALLARVDMLVKVVSAVKASLTLSKVGNDLVYLMVTP